MAPFVLLAPLIGPLLDRFRHGRRWALGTTLATRAFLAWVLASGRGRGQPVALPGGAGLPRREPHVRRGPGRGGATPAAPRHQPGHRELPPDHRRADRDGDRRRARRGLSRIGPDWSLRLAFVVYVAATVIAIRLPARVDSTAGELDLDGTPAGEGPLALPSAGRRRPAAAGAAALGALRAVADHRGPAAVRLPHPLPRVPHARAPAARLVRARRCSPWSPGRPGSATPWAR